MSLDQLAHLLLKRRAAQFRAQLEAADRAVGNVSDEYLSHVHAYAITLDSIRLRGAQWISSYSAASFRAPDIAAEHSAMV